MNRGGVAFRGRPPIKGPLIGQPTEGEPLLGGRNGGARTGLTIAIVIVSIVLIVVLALQIATLVRLPSDEEPISVLPPGVSMDTQRLLKDVDRRAPFPQGSGGPLPADPNMAVGRDRLIAVHNSDIVILDKATGEEIVRYLEDDFYEAPVKSPDRGTADPIVMYDHDSERFFVTTWYQYGTNADAQLEVTAPVAIVGTVPGSASTQYKGGPNGPTFEVTGNVVAADPLNADTPLTNAGAVAGNIALIASDGFVTGSVNKVGNAFAAGAVGAIIYDSESLEALTGGIFGIPDIPSLLVPGQIGLDILAQLGNETVTVTIRSVTPATGPWWSEITLAVSKNASPNSKDDFYRYVVGGDDPSQPYWNHFADYPKIGIDEKAFYVSAPKFESFATGGPAIRDQWKTVGIDKQKLISGTTAQSPANIALGDYFLTHTKVFDQSQAAPGIRVGGNVIPSIHNPGSAPRKRQVQVLAHFETNVTAAATLTIITNIDTVPVVKEWIVPVNPADDSAMIERPGFPGSGIVRRRQPAFFGGALKTLTGGPDTIMMYRGVMYENSVWYTRTVSFQNRAEVRWYEFDISRVLHGTGGPTLRQEGRIVGGVDADAYDPHINVDKDGNMGIAFVISGPNKYITLAHTGRLRNDPLGAVRYPYVEDCEATAPYVENPEFLSADTLLMRFNDYTSLDLDPHDGKTFWFYSQYVNQSLADLEMFITAPWRTAAVAFSIQGGEGLVNTAPYLEPPPQLYPADSPGLGGGMRRRNTAFKRDMVTDFMNHMKIAKYNQTRMYHNLPPSQKNKAWMKHSAPL